MPQNRRQLDEEDIFRLRHVVMGPREYQLVRVIGPDKLGSLRRLLLPTDESSRVPDSKTIVAINELLNEEEIRELEWILHPSPPPLAMEAPRELPFEFWARANYFQLIYSIAGLVLGLVCIIGGIILFLRGITGSTSWTAKIIGAESKVSDAAPGAILFIVGLFIVFVTRYIVKVKNR